MAFGCFPALVIAAAAASLPKEGCRAGAGPQPASLNCLKIVLTAAEEPFSVAAIPRDEVQESVAEGVVPQDETLDGRAAATETENGVAVTAEMQGSVTVAAKTEPRFTPSPPPEISLLSLERLSAAVALTGVASMYNPYAAHEEEAGSAQTASGEIYDPDAWTAAIQIGLRGQFGGVRYGRNYQPTYALVESGGRQAIVKINDVGPLRPGRIIDFNERTMRYFDPTLQRGVIADVRVTPLAGGDWTPGPVESKGRMSLAINFE